MLSSHQLVILLIVSSIIAQTSAQFPRIIAEQQVGFGQCLTDADCIVYRMGNGTLQEENIFCNQVTSRCNQGINVLQVNFTSACVQDITMTVNPYNSYIDGTADIECDGILVVEFTTMLTLQGLVRLYFNTNAGFVPDINNLGYAAEKFVNYPIKRYLFRGICPQPTTGIISVVFFNQNGCSIKKQTSVLIANGVNRDFNNPDFDEIDASTGFATRGFASGDGVIRVSSKQFLALAFDVSAWQFKTESSMMVGETLRIPFGHVFDDSGGLLLTVSGQDLYDPANTSYASFPLFNSLHHSDDVGPTYLAGTVSVQLGLGYARVLEKVGARAVFQFLQSECGVFEGRMGEPEYLELAQGVGLVDLPGFKPDMFFTLEGVNLNTFLVPDAQTSDVIDRNLLNENPKVHVTQLGTSQTDDVYGTCGRTSRIVIDYSAFGAGAQSMVSVLLQRVDITQNPVNLTDFAGDPLIFSPVLTTATFDVPMWGFYCATILNGFLGTQLQTCFQIGQLMATATQVRTQVPDPFDIDPGTLTIIGFGTKIKTFYHTVVPTTMIVHTGLEPVLRICKTSTNVTLQSELEFYDGDTYELFSEDMAMQYIANFYNIINHGRLSEYRLKRSRYHGENVFAEVLTDVAATVFGETATIKLQLVNMVVDPATLQQECMKRTEINLISYPRLRSRVSVDRATCPNERSLMVANAIGGAPFAFDNPIFIGVNFSLNEFQVPTSYFFKWYNDESNDILFSALGANRFPAPSNQRIRLEVYDAAGTVSLAYANAETLVSDFATRVLFDEQQPLCVNSANQSTVLQARLSGITQGPNSQTIFYWQPLDVLARELYNPNVPSFNIPEDCELLQNMTHREVFDLCFNMSDTIVINSTVFPSMCFGCTNLPRVYTGVDIENKQLVSFDDDSFWEAVVWVDSGFVNLDTNRSIYCRSANSTRVRIPFPPTLRFSNLKRISSTCIGQECFQVSITPIVDPEFSQFQSLVNFEANPPLGRFISGNPSGFAVRAGETYEFTVTLTQGFPVIDIFCPNTVFYIPLVRGPIIQVIQTTRSDCNIDTGSATIYMTYQDPDTVDPPAERSLCFFWRERNEGSVPFYQTFDSPVNSISSTTLPFSPFFSEGDDGAFLDVRAGLHTVMIWDRCPNYQDTCSNDCTVMIDPATLVFEEVFQLQNLAFTIRDFNISNFEDPGGGIVINRLEFTEAQCYGDSYFLRFEVLDDLKFTEQNSPVGLPPYEVFFFEPFTNEILARGEDNGIVPNNLYINQVVDGVKIRLFLFELEIETGPDFGIRFDGNYTLTVRSLTSGCIRTFSTFIEMVQPFDLILTAIPSNCAFRPGGLLPQISGGKPFAEGVLGTFSFPGPPRQEGSNITRQQLYRFFWNTPNDPPGVYNEVILPILNMPNNTRPYRLRVEDANACTAEANASITSPPPIVVEAVTATGTCQSSSQATLDIQVNGGTGALRTLENLTSISSGTNISFEFVASFQQTVEFHIIDSVGCLLPFPVSFTVPDPGPVNVSLEARDSCSNINDGRVTATAPDAVSFEWRVNSVLREDFRNNPVLRNVPPGSTVEVIVSTLINCRGFASISVGAVPPIFVFETRTTNGTFAGPCIDTIELTAGNNIGNQNFTIQITQNPNDAPFVFDGQHTIIVFNICRTAQYVFVVSEANGRCPTEYVSTDPGFGFGAGTVAGPPGLPPFVEDDVLFGAGVQFEEKKKGNNPPRGLGIAVAVTAILLVFLGGIGCVVGMKRDRVD